MRERESRERGQGKRAMRMGREWETRVLTSSSLRSMIFSSSPRASMCAFTCAWKSMSSRSDTSSFSTSFKSKVQVTVIPVSCQYIRRGRQCGRSARDSQYQSDPVRLGAAGRYCCIRRRRRRSGRPSWTTRSGVREPVWTSLRVGVGVSVS